MVALLELTREERQIVQEGSIPEPSFRPSPASRRFESEWDDSTEVRDHIRKSFTFERLHAAEYWRRHTADIALLATKEPSASSIQVIAVASVQGGPRLAVGGARRVTIGPWIMLESPLDWASIVDELPRRHQSKLDELSLEVTRPFTPSLGTAVSSMLADKIPNYAEIVADLTKYGRTTRRRLQSLEQRDAVGTVLSLLTPRWRSLAPEAESEPPPKAMRLERQIMRYSENDLITDDSAVFPGWERGGRPAGGWWEFRHREARMWIKNINVSDAETKTGADLVYVRTDPDTVVLVQYKLLKADRKGKPYLPRDRRLGSQIDRMLRHTLDSVDSGATDDFRIGEEFAFVKLVEQQGRTGLADDELTRGKYLPAGYARRFIAAPAQPGRRRPTLYLDDCRSLNSAAFTSLLRDCWIGSRGRVSKTLRQFVRAPSPTLTLAVHEAAYL